MNQPPDHDNPRDAHLLAALRHAPDRDALPPRQVSERILAAAHAAVRPRTAAPAPWWQRVAGWLTQPQVAASFGTLVAAVLVGVMWSTREPPLPEPSPPLDRAEQGARVDEGAIVEADKPPPLSDAAEPKASADETAPSAFGQARRKAASPEAVARQNNNPSAPRAEAGAGAVAESRAVAAAVAEAPSAAPSAAPPPATAAPAPMATDAPVGAAAAAAGRSAADADERQLLERRDAAPDAALRSRLIAKEGVVVDPLARWDAALGAGPSAAAHWRLGNKPDALPVAHGAAQVLWWAQLRQATAGRWARRAHAGTPQPPWLSLEVSAAAAAAIDFDSDGVLVCLPNSTGCWHAPITSAQREAWLAEVARW